MYFDSWSTSYFFWVIICFAVWGLAGFSVYGAINVFATRRNKYKKNDPLTPERIQELKMKAEQEAVIFAYKEAQQKKFEQEALETIKSVEEFVNKGEEGQEKEEIKVAETVNRFREEAGPENPGKKEIDHVKLKEIYEKELLKAKEEKLMIEEEKKEPLKEEKEEPLPQKEETVKEKKEETSGEHQWKEIDDVYRIAFGSHKC